MEGQYNARNPAVKRLFREAQELSDNPDEDFHAAPLEDNLFEWHFTIRGPADTPFENGLYHGRIILPTEYPMKPPNIIILTPNGRFETNTKICLSISGYHPETWQPSWSIRTALKALIGFMPTPGSGAIGSLELPDGRRRELALTSRTWACPDCLKQNHAILTSSTQDTVTSQPVGLLKSETEKGSNERMSAGLEKSPESASGDGDGEDASFSTSQPVRGRTSSLQSKPGRGIGKRAHFEDEAISSSASSSTPHLVDPSDSFPPKEVQLQSDPERPPLTTPSPTPTEGATTPLTAEEMRNRQSAILIERRRQLQERLTTTVTENLQNRPAATPLLASSDLARLERAINMLRQIMVLILFCVIFLILRRVVLVIDEDELEEL